MSVGEELGLTRLDLCQARKIAKERGKEIDGIYKGAITMIMNGIQVHKEKLRM